MSDHGLIPSYEGHKERRTGKNRGDFSGMHRALDGWMLARSPAYFSTMCGLEKLGFVDQNWLERILFSLLLRTLVVGRRQQSESIEVALDDME